MPPTARQCADTVKMRGIGLNRLPITQCFRVWMISVACLLVCPFSALGQTERTSDQRPSAMAPPDWLFPVNPPAPAKLPAYRGAVHVPHTRITFLPGQLSDLFSAPDWHPADHPVMPEVVAEGRNPGSMLAATAIFQMAEADQKTPAWRGCLQPTSRSKSLISGMARDVPPFQREFRRS